MKFLLIFVFVSLGARADISFDEPKVVRALQRYAGTYTSANGEISTMTIDNVGSDVWEPSISFWQPVGDLASSPFSLLLRDFSKVRTEHNSHSRSYFGADFT